MLLILRSQLKKFKYLASAQALVKSMDQVTSVTTMALRLRSEFTVNYSKGNSKTLTNLYCYTTQTVGDSCCGDIFKFERKKGLSLSGKRNLLHVPIMPELHVFIRNYIVFCTDCKYDVKTL